MGAFFVEKWDVHIYLASTRAFSLDPLNRMSFFGFGSKEVAVPSPGDLICMSVSRNFVAGSSFRHVDDVEESLGAGAGAGTTAGDDAESAWKDSKADTSSGSSSSSSGKSDSHSWKNIDASGFNLRVGPNYKKTGAKAPSGPSLYELVGLDVIQSPKRIDDIASKIDLPADWTCVPSNHPLVPPVLVINAQLPSSFDSSFFTEITDGDGWSLVHYFRIRPEVAEELKDVETASPAVRLLARYYEHAPAQQKDSYSDWFGRFKLILRCENIDEFGLPSFITSYNGKPVLIRNTGELNIVNTNTTVNTEEGKGQGGGKHYADMTINVHRFASLPKKGLSTLMAYFDKMDISTAFCVEGRVDDEMPEVLLGCARIHKPDYKKAPHWGEIPLKQPMQRE